MWEKICSSFIKMVIPRPICESHMEIISVLYKGKFLLKVFPPLLSVLPSQNFMEMLHPELTDSQLSLSFFSYFSFFPYFVFWRIYLFFIIFLSVCIDISWRKILSLSTPFRVYRVSSFLWGWYIFLSCFLSTLSWHLQRWKRFQIPYFRDGLDSSKVLPPPLPVIGSEMGTWTSLSQRDMRGLLRSPGKAFLPSWEHLREQC